MLAHSYDTTVGGMHIDDLLFERFAQEFTEKFKVDARTNARATLRLRTQCEKLKKTLSANPVELDTPINVECMMEDTDVSGMYNRSAACSVQAFPTSRVQSSAFLAICTRMPPHCAAASSVCRWHHPQPPRARTLLSLASRIAVLGSRFTSSIQGLGFRVQPAVFCQHGPGSNPRKRSEFPCLGGSEYVHARARA